VSQFKYDGDEERVIVSLGITVNKGDVFEAPEDFSAYGCFSANSTFKKSAATAVAPEPSVPSDTTVDEVK